MNPKNTICIWFDKEAHAAAQFYAATFPDSQVTAVHKAPADYPGGKKGDVLTAESTVLDIPCLFLNGGGAFKHTESDPLIVHWLFPTLPEPFSDNPGSRASPTSFMRYRTFIDRA